MVENSSKLHALVQKSVEKYGIIHRVMDCDPTFADTAAFCERYGFSQGQSANTIIVVSKNDPPQFACCVVLATTKLDVNKTVRNLLKKRASFATAEQTKAETNMDTGGVTVFGIENMPIYVDSAVFTNKEIVMGGGNRSTKLLLNPQELKKLPNLEIITLLAAPR